MSKPDPNTQKKVTAQSFKRLAKALRVRARNHSRLAKLRAKGGFTMHATVQAFKADILAEIASDLDHEATTLRGMR